MGIQGAVERTSYGAGRADPSLVPQEKEGFLCAKHCAGHRRYVVSETDKLCLTKLYPPAEIMEGARCLSMLGNARGGVGQLYFPKTAPQHRHPEWSSSRCPVP